MILQSKISHFYHLVRDDFFAYNKIIYSMRKKSYLNKKALFNFVIVIYILFIQHY